MKLYHYDLGIYPLDWEFGLFNIEEYKAKLANKYAQNEPFYQAVAGELTVILQQIDELLQEALAHWEQQFTYNSELRCPPMIFALPSGDHRGSVVFGIVLKREEDGDTIVYSPVQLPHLEGY